MTNTSSLQYAKKQDAIDPLKGFKNEFHFPKDKAGNSLIYLCGNSLGLQPKNTAQYIEQELKDWANLGVEGHTHAKNPWMPYHELLTQQMANIVGAKYNEVVIMNGLTTNLHLMMVSFYQPTASRFKIIIEKDAFPSDKYAVESQLNFHGYNPKEGLLLWSPRPGEELCRLEDLEQLLQENKNEVALILIGNTNYYSGQFYPIKQITQLGHQNGAKVGFDLAHGVGNILPNLHDNEPDFAVWCTYKYLNSGPGNLGGIFVHEKHAKNNKLPRFAGWWGHNKQTRFNMRQEFDALKGAEGWQLSNPPILSMAAIRASLIIFEKAGMQNLREKSILLTGYLESLLQQLNSKNISIITPNNKDERGCQLSIQVKNADKSLHTKLTETGVVSDWREPDVIRVAPTPLYNSFEEVWKFVERLKKLI